MKNLLNSFFLLFAAFVLASLLSCEAPDHYDLLLINGSLVDGLGNVPMEGTVGIRDGKMYLLEVGKKVEAEETVDVTGLVVAPGFVDVHNHTERAVVNEAQKLNEGFVRQGVTTIVGGPDGYMSPATLRMLIDSISNHGAGTNVASYIGHNFVRREAMGDDYKRVATATELDTMKKMVVEGMELGAVGLSTGLMYEPGMFSTTEEVIELAKEVAPFNGVYDSHVRNPVHAFLDSDKEVIRIATEAGIPGKIGHLKAVGLHNEGVINDIIRLVEEARAAGNNIVSDQYPYDGAATADMTRIVVVPGDMPGFEKSKAANGDPTNPAVIQELKAGLNDLQKRGLIKKTSEAGENGGFAWLKATGYTSMRITSSEDYPELVGKYLSEIAEEKGMDPFDAVCDMLINADNLIFLTLGAIKEKDVQTLLIQPWNMVASDGAYVSSGQTGGHPRSTGSFPRVLGHYARDLKLLTLEEAVRKMTSLPADFIGLPSRGRLADGLPADITIFDPQTIIDQSTFENPTAFAAGVKFVLINGVFVLKEEEMTGQAPGKFLKRER